MSAPADALISLIIPAWNEAELLPRLLDSVDAARARFEGGSGRIEVIVADNSSTDRTAEIARSRGCLVASVAKRCIAAVRNGGAAIARGEFLAFSDADLRIDQETFNYIAHVMHRPGFIGGGTGLVMERWSLGIRATLYLVLPPLWLIGLDGGVWFCRHSDFQAVGGDNEEVRVGEDVRLLLTLKRLGRHRRPRERLATRFTARKLGFAPPYAINSARKFDKHGDWHMFRGALRHLPSLLFRRQVADQYIDRYWYSDR
jgi:glycosyltransferase involved in cell wall biosynthesis